MGARSEAYKPPFDKHFLLNLSAQRNLSSDASEALQLLQEFHIKRYLAGSQIMESTKGLIQGWTGDDRVKVVEARVRVSPSSIHVNNWIFLNELGLYPLNTRKDFQMALRYCAHPNTFPQPDREMLTFTWNQGKVRLATELEYQENVRVSVEQRDKGIGAEDFQAMRNLGLAINFFAAEAAERRKIIREDFQISNERGTVINFLAKSPTSAAA